jgi:VWFA-related protein
MSMVNRLRVGVALGLFLPGTTARCSEVLYVQEEEERPFRVEVTVVPVDILVFTRGGQPVGELSSRDFVVLEDGRPQEITHFLSRDSGAEWSVVADDEAVQAWEPSEPDPNYRTFLIFFGRGRHNHFDAFGNVAGFVGETLAENDRVAVMAYNRATPFLRDPRPILRLLEAFEGAHEDLETALRSRGGELSVAYGSARIPESVQPRIDEIFDLASIREVVAPEAPEVDLGRDKDRGDLESMEKERRDQAYEELLEETGVLDRGFRVSREYNRALAEMISDIPFDEYMKQRGGAYHDVSHLYAAIEYLRSMPGEKVLLYFSESGIVFSKRDDAVALGRAAGDARVRVIAFQTGGTTLEREEESFDRAFRSARQGTPVYQGSAVRAGALRALQDIAEISGGRRFLSSDLGRGLEWLTTSHRAHYLLGYRSQAEVSDGSLRRIEVRLKGRRANLHYRKAYYSGPR